MSFKGIAWAGNVYEKFEAMCLEVEEAMYQDTVKYMENQVQKVGVSVKKFCSEVMDDLRPLSCVDPMSIASEDSSLYSHGLTDVHKKSIPSILSKKENEDQALSGKGSSPIGYDVNLFSPQSPGIFIENKLSEKCEASKKIGIHRRSIGIKRISRNNHPTKESSRDTSVSEDRRSKVVNCDRTNSRLASDNTDVTSSSDLNGRHELWEAFNENASILNNSVESPASDKMSSSKSLRQDTSRVAHDDTNGTSSSGLLVCESRALEKGNTPSCDNLVESPATKKVSSAEPLRQIEYVADCISPASDNNLLDESARLKGDPKSTSSCFSSPKEFTGVSVSDTPFSLLGSSITSKVCNLEYEEVTLPVKGAIMKNGSSSASSTPGNTESCNKQFITSGDSFDMEFVENDEVAEARPEKFETRGKAILEESCILVEEDELHHALEETKKHKSYKKRIREAISSKLKPRKDKEFVSQGQGKVRDKKQEMSAPAKQKLSTHDSVESDWELL